ncbi:MAG: DapH/DapD/GlmU-related protein [Promethearchaeia archaeon]
MFQPASLKGDSPTPIDEKIRKKYLFIYFIIILMSLIPSVLFEYYYFILLWKPDLRIYFFLLSPLNIISVIYILQCSALIISKIALTLCNLLHYPKEGVFERNIKDKDYLFWNIRNIIKKWPLYISATNPFPWLKNRFTLRFFGVKIGKNCICDNAWISSEFIEVGNNVIIGMGSTILSFGMDHNKFFLRKITIEDNVTIGAKCVILPGAHLQENVKVSAHSYVNFEQNLRENGIYKGHPVELKKEDHTGEVNE